MIAVPPDWRWTTSIGCDVFTSPDRTCQVRYRMRVAPLARFAAIVDAVLVDLPEWSTVALEARTRLVTHEGEHAFGVAATGNWLDRAARRYVGVVYGDDFFDVLDAIDLGGEALDARAIAWLRGASLHLGLRRRRYFYERPSGWRGHASGLTAHWYPPGFPTRASTIVVYPAMPSQRTPVDAYRAMSAHQRATGGGLDELSDPSAITSRYGLEGMHWRLDCVTPSSQRIARDLVVFAGRGITYAMQLDSVRGPDEPAREQFLALARSVEPVPVGHGPADEGAVFAHYV